MVLGILEHEFFQHNVPVEEHVSQGVENYRDAGRFSEEDGSDIGGSDDVIEGFGLVSCD